MSANKTIVQINTVAAPHSGVGNVMHGINDGLRAQGYNGVMIAGYGRAEHADYTMQGRLGYYFNALSARRHGNDGFGARRVTEKLVNILKSLKPDIVHLHNAHGYYLNLPMLTDAIARMRIPLVITAHDLWLCTGRCAVPDECLRWQQLDCDKCQNYGKYPGVFSLKPPFYPAKCIGALDTHIVVPTERMADFFSKSTLAHLPVSVIPNGVDRSVFYQTPRRRQQSELRLLAVATKWDENKNPGALAGLVEAMPDDWHLTVVGRGATRIIRSDRRRITFIPNITDRARLADLYRSSDVLLSPSRWESFGATIVEAAACGIPSVVRSVPPIEGVSIRDSFEDRQQLITRIREAAKIATDSNNISTKEEMAASYISLYNQISGNCLSINK